MTLGELAYNEFKAWRKPHIQSTMVAWSYLPREDREAWQLAALAVLANRTILPSAADLDAVAAEQAIKERGPRESTAYGLIGGR